MKKINYLKIILDLLMAIVFVLLFNKNAIAGMAFHEIAGLVIGSAFVFHILINFKWVKQVTLKFFNSKMSFKTRLGYIVDALLLISMAAIIITGIMISKVLFPGIGNSSSNFRMLHISISYFALLLIGVHIGLHWAWAMNMFKRIFKIPDKNKFIAAIAVILVLVTFIYGSYNIYSANYFSKIFTSTAGDFRGHGPDGFQGRGPGDMNNIPGSDGTEGQSSGSNINPGNNQDIQNNNINQPDSQNTPDSRRPGAGFSGKGNGRRPGEGFNSSNPLKTIISNLSIISVFSLLTYYIEKLLKRHPSIQHKA